MSRPACTISRGACDLYRFDPRPGEERKLDALSTAASAEVRPAIHEGAVVFARLRGPRVEILRDRERLYAVDLAADPFAEDVLGMDHEAQGIAFVIEDDDARANRLYLLRRGRRVETIGGGGIGEENHQVVRAPTFAGRHVYWAFANQHTAAPRDQAGWVVRYDLRTKRRRAARAPGFLVSVAADPRRPETPLVAVSDDNPGYPGFAFGRQRLHELQPRFGPVPPHVG